MRLVSFAVPIGAGLVGGAIAFVGSSPACEIVCGAGALLAAAPVVLFVVETLRPDDPYRRHRRSPD
jgi:hypothetical protein